MNVIDKNQTRQKRMTFLSKSKAEIESKEQFFRFKK
jgi:hypothetical protein